MTQAKPSDYWFSTTALWIQLNAAGDRNYIDANCGSAAAVLVYMKGIAGLGAVLLELCNFFLLCNCELG